MAQHNRLDNRGELEGYLGQAPDINRTPEGKLYARLSISNTNRWTDKETTEIKEHTHWFNVVFWNENLIEKVIRQYLFKGSKVRVEYSLRTRKWNTNFINADGTTFAPTMIELVGNELKMCDSREVSDKRREAAQQEATQQAAPQATQQAAPQATQQAAPQATQQAAPQATQQAAPQATQQAAPQAYPTGEPEFMDEELY